MSQNRFNTTTVLLFTAMKVPREELEQIKLKALQDEKMKKSAKKDEGIWRNKEMKGEVKQNPYMNPVAPKHSYASREIKQTSRNSRSR